MSLKLTLRAASYLRGGDRYGHGPQKFEVDGLPAGDAASISNHDVLKGWQIQISVNGAFGDWTGSFRSKEEALAALEKTYSNET
jgi:hypothetical protein